MGINKAAAALNQKFNWCSRSGDFIRMSSFVIAPSVREATRSVQLAMAVMALGQA